MAADPSESTTPRGGLPTPAQNAFFAPSALWTEALPKTAHVDIFRHCDYTGTTLGQIPGWGPALRLYTAMILADSRAGCLYWGPDRVAAVYNEKFAPYCAGTHPFLMGKPFKVGFPEIHHQISPLFDQAFATAQTIDVEDILLVIERNGYSEETYFIGQFIPLRGDSGEIEGLYNTVYESTARVLYDRRRRVVQNIAAIQPHSVDDTISLIMDSLHGNPNDITMAMLYAFDSLAPAGGANLVLRGTLGIPEGHTCAPTKANLENEHTGMIPYFRQASLSGRPIVLSQSNGNLQAIDSMFKDIAWRGFGEASRVIVVVPLTMGGSPLGFYVQGTNPRRVYDPATEMSIVDMVRQMEARWASSFSTEQAKLREQILERRAIDSENRLRHMAQCAPVGMCQITPDLNIHWANEQFYEITGHDPTRPSMHDFFDVIAAEHVEAGSDNLDDLMKGASRMDREYRLKRAWTAPVEEDKDTEPSSAWILTSGFPLIEDGRVKLVMAYITDISHQKWAESVQSRNAAAAVQAKRRQDEFIDTTSHEMRNPLTAITQLADSISTSLLGAQDSKETYRSIAQESVDSAKTILACAAHQKRVIDDVLTLSRLESEMLSITPVIGQPAKVVADAIKMFEGEAALQGVEIESVQASSYESLGVDYFWIDTSRLMQILINLLSNAIKFTATRTERKVSVMYGAQTRRPPSITTALGELNWILPLQPHYRNEGVPNKKPLHFYTYVQDTGPGITRTETERLFKRYSQLNSRTHTTYGGSGLGLYISRQLAEKQNGGIGVVSRHGEGSVFGFYVETMAAADAAELPPRTPSSQPDMSNGEPRVSKRRLSDSKATGKVEAATGIPQALNSSRQIVQRRGQQDKTFHILLVEDNVVNQRVLAKQLRSANCIVIVANHGAEALQLLEKTDCWGKTDDDKAQAADASCTAEIEEPAHIDVILMDWEMPVMDGLECCRRIRELEAEGHIIKRLPIIATTANVRQEQQKQAVTAGMDIVVVKPFTTPEILQTIREILARD